MFVYIWCLEENVLVLSNWSCAFQLLICDSAFVQLSASSCSQVLTICCALAPSSCAWRHSVLHCIGGAGCLCTYYLARILYMNDSLFRQCSLHFTLLSICLRILAIYRVICLSVYCGTSHNHGVWGYFVHFLSSENSIFEPPILPVHSGILECFTFIS